jgi:hypothetical protein
MQRLADSSSVLATQPILVRQWEQPPPVIPPSNGVRSNWDNAIAKLHSMFSLGNDWDGMGAKAPPAPLINGAIELAEQLSARRIGVAPTRVAATPCGTVVLEWQQPNLYMEVEITEPNSSDWMFIPDGEAPIHRTFAKWSSIETPTGPNQSTSLVWQDTSPYMRADNPEFQALEHAGLHRATSPAYWANTGFLKPTG